MSNHLESKNEDLKIPSKISHLKKFERVGTSIIEVDRALGGGLVRGSLYLLTGEPGSGKSTLVSQISSGIFEQVFYFSGEETISHLIDRFSRLELDHKKIEFFHERNLSVIVRFIEKYKPQMIVIDSIQTMLIDDDFRAGAINTIKEVINSLLVISKKLNITILVIGHVTKSGQLAGPKMLEHMVDVYLCLSVDKKTGFKKLVAEKNRFGETEIPGFFKMTKKGLEETVFPGELKIKDEFKLPIGSVVTYFNYGVRYGLVEVVVLLNKQFESMGKRVVQNFSLNKLHIICAQIEKIFQIDLKKFDIFVEVPNLIDQSHYHVDLAICSGILSNYFNKPQKNTDLYYGQMSLSGDVSHNQRSSELRGRFSKVKQFIGPGGSKDLKKLRDLKFVFGT